MGPEKTLCLASKDKQTNDKQTNRKTHTFYPFCSYYLNHEENLKSCNLETWFAHYPCLQAPCELKHNTIPLFLEEENIKLRSN